MKTILLFSLFFPVGGVGAVCIGQFNTISDWQPSPIVLRDIADGRWSAGGAADVWGLSCDSLGKRRRVLEAGYYGTWDADSFYSNYGIHAGIPASYLTAALNAWTGIPDPLQQLSKLTDTWKPFKYMNVLLSLDGFYGYRPHLGPDLLSHHVYGYMLRLNIKWTQKEAREEVARGL